MDPFSVFSLSDGMVMIHKGWRSASSLPITTPKALPAASNVPGTLPVTPPSSADPTTDTPRNFAFINGTTPFRNRDPEIRRLVRAHVVKDGAQKRKQMQKRVSNSKAPSPKIPALYPDSQVYATTISLILDPNPELSPVIYHITLMGTAMWPLDFVLKFNPISPAGWFDWALSEEVLLHALLYTTSTYAGLLRGTTEDRTAIVHVGKTLAFLRERVVEDGGLEGEGTIAAISCLALTEAIRGNLDAWAIHERGIKKVVDMKGGLDTLSLTLQLKLHRADLTGAISFLALPFFSTANTLPKSCPYTSTSRRTTPLNTLLKSLPIAPSLKQHLLSLSALSATLSTLLESKTLTTIPAQITLLKQTYALRYALLSSPIITQTHPSSHTSRSNTQLLDEALRLGALLYMQTTLQEFPMAAVGSRLLVERLKRCLLARRVEGRKETELLLWLLVVGGVEAKEESQWWVEQLSLLATELGLRNWEDAKGRLETLWWIERVHGERGRRLWSEVRL